MINWILIEWTRDEKLIKKRKWGVRLPDAWRRHLSSFYASSSEGNIIKRWLFARSLYFLMMCLMMVDFMNCFVDKSSTSNEKIPQIPSDFSIPWCALADWAGKLWTKFYGMNIYERIRFIEEKLRRSRAILIMVEWLLSKISF